MRPRIVIAGVSSGVGKTTVTLGVMAAFVARGLDVQGFKVGPDYIDPSYHAAVTGRPSRNLDTWMTQPDVMREIFDRASALADVSIIEGVMGLFDGRDALANDGSTADVSVVLGTPVLLVVDVSSMARSAAAIVLGFQQMEPNLRLAGVIVNRVGSRGHYEMVRAAIMQVCGVPVVGYLQSQSEWEIPERHLGLIPALERGEVAPLFKQLAKACEETLDLDLILSLARSADAWVSPAPKLFAGVSEEATVTIAVARDQAFNFYYPENLELLAWFGANLVFFSPLAGECIPKEADGLYLGGGFPEEFAAVLAGRTEVLDHVRQRIEEGMPTLAECGGFMFLTRAITDRLGHVYPMVGVIPASVTMQARLAALGYREARALTGSVLMSAGDVMRGHEFHYSTVTWDDQTVAANGREFPGHAYEVTGIRGVKQEG
ncbi:MAG: cobyrinate a,c-diamide synthase, partial [Firmicutes bacterium]|nr:cobyrinate a,c-diamide synthase [Bacillota bacterium]